MALIPRAMHRYPCMQTYVCYAQTMRLLIQEHTLTRGQLLRWSSGAMQVWLEVLSGAKEGASWRVTRGVCRCLRGTAQRVSPVTVPPPLRKAAVLGRIERRNRSRRAFRCRETIDART
jgi:hypothetical protein